MLTELPAVIHEDIEKELLPKEAWLVDFARAERDQGRKTLIYLRQTGTRDIQYRLERDYEGCRCASAVSLQAAWKHASGRPVSPERCSVSTL